MLKHASIIISLTLAGLYVIGLSFHQGFLSELSIEESLFQLSPDRTFFTGFVSVVTILSPSIVYLFFSAFLIVMMAEVASLMPRYVNTEEIYKYLRKIGFEKSNLLKKGSFLDFSSKAFVLSGFMLIFYLMILVAILSSVKSGKEYAKSYVNKIEKNEIPVKTLSLKNSNEKLEVYSLICSSTHCAYYSKGKTLVVSNREVLYSKTK
ncbi:hypothetical protein [Desulfogranum marinum]|uniref:hypothetical protein n=1 Tax=Desulfogranum marinum TaxID=453220 RepID=UPI0029C76D1D|nr:hypothetical protein [Desulfogranum marinum]